ncbi:MAG: hypothetical protein LBJ18_02675 [Rickettsiales bacterium]|nr:hypothetical protein [Rickettsiales bacterium]
MPVAARADIASTDYIRRQIATLTGVSVSGTANNTAAKSYLLSAIDELNQVAPYSVATNYSGTIDGAGVLGTSAVNSLITSLHNCWAAGGYKNGTKCEICPKNYYCPMDSNAAISCETVGAGFITMFTGANGADKCYCMPSFSSAGSYKVETEDDLFGYWTVSGATFNGCGYGGYSVNVSGISRCSSSGGYARGQKITSGEPADDNGQYCWCKLADISSGTLIGESPWVFNMDYSTGENCINKITDCCADDFKNNIIAPFRENILSNWLPDEI